MRIDFQFAFVVFERLYMVLGRIFVEMFFSTRQKFITI